MEEQLARLVAGVGVLIWGVLALVSLFLERRHPDLGSQPGASPPGDSPDSSHSRAV